MVSGGAIASLYLNEPVNDYDVYIQDYDVLLALTKYYTGLTTDITIIEGRLKDSYVIPVLENGEQNNSAWAVSVRNLKPDQIKLFFEDKDGGKDLIKYQTKLINLYFLAPMR